MVFTDLLICEQKQWHVISPQVLSGIWVILRCISYCIWGQCDDLDNSGCGNLLMKLQAFRTAIFMTSYSLYCISLIAVLVIGKDIPSYFVLMGPRILVLPLSALSKACTRHMLVTTELRGCCQICTLPSSVAHPHEQHS